MAIALCTNAFTPGPTPLTRTAPANPPTPTKAWSATAKPVMPYPRLFPVSLRVCRWNQQFQLATKNKIGGYWKASILGKL